MIKIDNLTVSFDTKKTIDNLSLEIKDGITCIMGESGCGKTTLLRTIAGLNRYDSGKISGVPKKIAFMFQEDRLFPWYSAKENVMLVTNSEEKAVNLLKQVELDTDMDKKPSELSGGMKRRVALARALGYDAEIMIFDEPFKGMDSELRDRMIRLISESGKTVIIATHSEKEVEMLGGEKVVLKKIQD